MALDGTCWAIEVRRIQGTILFCASLPCVLLDSTTVKFMLCPVLGRYYIRNVFKETINHLCGYVVYGSFVINELLHYKSKISGHLIIIILTCIFFL